MQFTFCATKNHRNLLLSSFSTHVQKRIQNLSVTTRFSTRVVGLGIENTPIVADIRKQVRTPYTSVRVVVKVIIKHFLLVETDRW